MDPAELVREGEKARKEMERLERSGALTSAAKLAGTFDTSAMAALLGSIRKVDMPGLIDRRVLLSSLAASTTVAMSSVDTAKLGADLLAAFQSPSLAELAAKGVGAAAFRTEMMKVSELASKQLWTASAVQSLNQLSGVLKELNSVPSVAPWTILAEESKSWPGRLGLAGVLAKPTPDWFERSIGASVAWDAQSAALAGIATASSKAALATFADQLRVNVAGATSLAGLATRSSVTELVQQALTSIPDEERQQVVDLVEALVPAAIDGDPVSTSTRDVLVVWLVVMFFAGLVMPGARQEAGHVAQQMLGTADLIVDQAVAFGAHLADRPLVKATSVAFSAGSAGYGGYRVVRKALDKDDTPSPE